MDPFRHDPYDSDSGDDGSFSGAVSEHAQTLTAHAKALMRGDLEVSPLVTNVPPMPEAKPVSAKPAPVIPSNFRGGMQQVALKKRKIDPQVVARAFVEESQEVVLPQPSSTHRTQEEHSQQGFFSTTTSLPSTEGMNPPPPVYSGTDMLAVLTTAAAQSIPFAEETPIESVKSAPVPQAAANQGPADDKKASIDGIFDDADGDMSAEAPKYESPSAADPSKASGSKTEGVTTTSPKKALLTEVGGTSEVAKSKEQEKYPSALKSPAEQETKVAAKSSNAAKRKSIPKASGKVLTAKREREMADSLLWDKDDLLDFLPKEDCMFLGKHFWIFTVAQLRSVLRAESEKTKEMRESLLSKLPGSQLYEGVAAANASGAADEESNGRVSAEERLRHWQTQIDSGAKGKHVEKRFPLDGPISFLFPRAATNFLASVRVGTLYQFFSYKKTETGAIVEYLKMWRKKCKLPELSLLALAKHLLGVTARIEMALTPDEPIDERTQKWMIDPIIVMTGAARDFIVDDQGILTAADFVEARTKDLSLKLAEWRERNKMVPLRGSGKVAMISGWKAAAREAIEAEINYGKKLPDIDFEAEAALELPVVSGVKSDDRAKKGTSAAEAPPSKSTAQSSKSPKHPKEPVYTRKLTVSTSTRPVQYALSTKLFLDDVLGEDVTQILVDAGVTTAAEFYKLTPEKEAELRKFIIKAKKAPSDASSRKLIDEWDKKLKKELESMAPKKPPDFDDASVEQPQAKKAKTTADKKGVVEKKREVTPKATASRQKMGDPYDSLSAVTKRFLITMEIDTAKKFLTTRTTDIALEFVDWRKKEGMVELKGLGAIASVSGWKANVRKAAKDMGKEDIVVMEPDNKSSWGPHSRNLEPKSQRPKLKQSSPSPMPIAKPNPVVHEDVLAGKPRVIFAVSGGTVSGHCKQYRFELSVRRPDDSSSVALFATYRGAATFSGEVPQNDYTLECASLGKKTTSRRSVMKEVEYVAVGKSSTEVDVRSSFSSDLPGAGLVFLSPYGVRPLRNQDLCLLKLEIKAFVLDGKEKSSIPIAEVKTQCNTIMRRNAFNSAEFFLYLQRKIEKGQCVEVCFKELSYHLQSGPYWTTNYQRRHLLDEAFGLLSRSDLNQLISFLEDEVIEATNYQQALSLMPTDTSNDSADRFKAACGARRRLHWVAVRIACALRDWFPPPPPARSEDGIRESGNKLLYFGPLLSQQEEIKTLSVGSMPDFKSVLEVEVRNELLSALELDTMCGSEPRKSWCPLFTTTFERVTDCIVEYYLKVGDPSGDDMLESLGSCLSECVATPIEEQVKDLILTVRPSESYGNNPLDDGLHEVIEKILQDRGSSSDSDQEAVELIACNASDDVEMTDDEPQALVMPVAFRTPNGFDDSSATGNISPNKAWYRQRQWWIMMTVVAKAGLLLSPEEQEKFIHPRALYELKNRFLKDSGLASVQDAALETLQHPRLPNNLASGKDTVYEPHSYPFFLGLVWPKLRALGWRLEAGDSPKNITFIAPDIKTIPTKRANPWKQRRDIVRTVLARETNRTGIGNLTKTTKRLVVSTIPHPEGDEVESEPLEPITKGVSSSEALQRFLQHVESKLDKDDTNGNMLAARVVNIVKNCFDELAPMMTTEVGAVEGEAHTSDAAQAPPSERYGCDFLLRFLLVLPSILRQSELPLQEINDCTEIIRELVDWMTADYPKLLNEKYHPPKESYAPPKQPKQTPPDLSQRLRMLHEATAAAAAAAASDPAINSVGSGGSNMLVMKELLRPEDKSNLTDFLVMVLEQAIPCRATESDVAKKYRRVNVGFPGFVCRHCMGGTGEGRYFFSTVESLTTASTVFEKHVGKCKSVPEEIKAAVVDAKTRHADQRKLFPMGAQQAYFNRLWDRLRSSHIEGIASGTYVLEGTAKKDTADATESATSEDLEFRSHIHVLDFVRSHAPWKSSSSVQEAVNQYYGCIDYGGRVFYTSSMPDHFSSEWLLRKVSPRPKRSRKKRLMPG